ncbi:legumain-like isoform X1 [Tachysurus ichikawai]
MYASGFKEEPGNHIPKAGAIAQAGVGRAGAVWDLYAVEANGPNASARLVGLEARAMSAAELGSVSAVAGPMYVKLGLGIGVSVGLTGIEIKILGTVVSLGTTIGMSLFGSEAKIKFF